MALLDRLFPWYRWSDRWGWHLEFLGEGSAVDPIIYTAPPGFRFHIHAIIGTAEGHALGGGFKVRATARRGHLIFAASSSAIGATATQTNLIAFQLHGENVPRDTDFKTLQQRLTSAFKLLPGDTLTIEGSGSNANNHLHDWVFTAKRWDD